MKPMSVYYIASRLHYYRPSERSKAVVKANEVIWNDSMAVCSARREKTVLQIVFVFIHLDRNVFVAGGHMVHPVEANVTVLGASILSTLYSV